jgi:PIN domain nuclease of toxin-antitoxin system
VRLLLDTHALIWWFAGDLRMVPRVKSLIDNADVVHVSAASAWELATKHRSGKLPEADELIKHCFEFVAECDFRPLSVTLEHGYRAGLLEGAHKDPFDRMLAAQAIVDGLGLVTIDPAMAKLGARVVW